jgi:hypothetical protein
MGKRKGLGESSVTAMIKSVRFFTLFRPRVTYFLFSFSEVAFGPNFGLKNSALAWCVALSFFVSVLGEVDLPFHWTSCKER